MITENLIWLVRRDFFPELTDKVPEGVSCAPLSGSYYFRGQTIEIGRAVLNPWEGEGTPLGAYDKTNLGHLQQMLIDFRRLAPPLNVSAG